MALLDDSGLPKKKMKQAQLPFCNLAPKSQKRKLSTDLTDEVQQVKIMCKEPESPSNEFGPNKENTSNLNNTFVKNEICELKTDKSDNLSKNISEKLSDNVNIESCVSEQGNASIEENSEISLSISDSVLESINNSRVYSMRKSADSESADEVTVDKSAGVEGEKEKMDVELEEKPEEVRSDVEVTKEEEESMEKEEETDTTSENGVKNYSKIYVSDKESGSCTNMVIRSLRSSLNKLLEFEEGEVMDVTISSEEDELPISSDDSVSPKSKLNTSSSPRTPSTKTTPKRVESVKKREERERLRNERQAEIDRKKEEKIKLKIEKEEKRKKEKEEREKKRQEEIRAKEEEKKKKEEAKEEEKKKKEEERRMKEEEKRKKEEERRMKEDEKRKKEEAKEEEKRRKEEKQSHSKALFASFFVPRKKRSGDASGDKSEEAEEVKLNFMPFSVKPDMRLAVDRRRILNNEAKLNLETIIDEENPKDVTPSYISDIKSGKHPPLKSEATWPLSPTQEDHDVIIIESTAEGECIDLISTEECLSSKKNKKTKAKLLQFHDNRRPPYWGTWRKESKDVKARRPLGKDTKTFDYEIDSDSEWEDEGEGENIENECESGEENDDKEEEEVVSVGENGYILDNTFVPHGYLSDEEAQAVEEVDDNDPENQKIRMTLLKQEFEEEMKSKTERLNPRLLGCVWISNGTSEVSKGSLYESLMQYRAVWNEDDGPVDVLGPVVDESPGVTTPSIKSRVFPSAVIGHLAKMIHGSHRPLSQIIREFLAYLEKDHPTQHISKRAVTLKCKEISTKTYDSNGKPTWLVNADICKEFDIKGIPQPSPPQPPVDKGGLKTFLSPSGSPGPPKKRVALTTLTSETSLDPSSPVTTIGSEDNKKHIDTPRPRIFPSYPIGPPKTEETPGTPKTTTEPPVKKRVALITLSPKTPEVPTPLSGDAVKHQDTPRPIHPFFRAALGMKSKTVETPAPGALVDLTNED